MSCIETPLGKLPDNWVIDTMESVLEYIIDYRGKTPEKSDSGIATLSAKSVKGGYIDYSKAYFISPNTYKSFMVRGLPQIGDILMTTEAPLGCIAELDRNDVGIAQRLLTLRGKDGYMDNGFLMYYLMSKTGQQQLHSKATGTTVTGIKQSEFRKVLIAVPPILEQRSIASIMGSIDRMIALNNQTSNIIEEIAHAIFKSWFLDFEFPNDSGQSYKSSVGKMIDSELGTIPIGWRAVELGKITTNLRDKTKSNDFKVLSAVNTGNLMLSEEYFTKQVFSKNLSKYIIVREKEFAYNPSRVNIGSIGMNEYDFDGCVSPVYVVFKAEKNYQWFFKLFIKTDNFKSEVLKRASGSVRQTMNYCDFALIKIIYPPKGVIDKFNKIFETCYFAQKELIKETEILSNIRNELLPKLMSGEMRVPIEEAV